MVVDWVGRQRRFSRRGWRRKWHEREFLFVAEKMERVEFVCDWFCRMRKSKTARKICARREVSLGENEKVCETNLETEKVCAEWNCKTVESILTNEVSKVWESLESFEKSCAERVYFGLDFSARSEVFEFVFREMNEEVCTRSHEVGFNRLRTISSKFAANCFSWMTKWVTRSEFKFQLS